MAIDLINGTDAAIAAFGGGTETVPARGITVSSALTTDAQAAAGVQANASTCTMKSGSSATDRAKCAGVLLDSILASMDLSTPKARELFRIRAGLQEYADILNQIGI